MKHDNFEAKMEITRPEPSKKRVPPPNSLHYRMPAEDVSEDEPAVKRAVGPLAAFVGGALVGGGFGIGLALLIVTVVAVAGAALYFLVDRE